MPSSIDAVSSSLEALTEQYRSITGNLANANTPGFKRTRVSFEQTLAEAVSGSASSEQSGPATGQVSANGAIDFSQGAMTQTGRALDLALGGRGFFTLKTVDGELYTRSGKLHVNDQRQLVDSVGRIVGGSGGAPIVAPATVSTMDIRVTREGDVRAGGTSIGRLEIVDFDDLSKLAPRGSDCFEALEGAGRKDAVAPAVRQRHLESSNVSVVEELVGLIMVTRLYEANIKSISVQDEQMKNILEVAMS
ncbi:MAG: flagellar hook-basal body protein [Phycisphaerae bacterium]